MPPNLVGRLQAIEPILEAGGDRTAFYSPENQAGTPVYVHAKVCIVDDVWCSVGSDNVNLRSWTHDSELACAVVPDDVLDLPVDPHPGETCTTFAHEVRLRLAREHLDREAGDDTDLIDAGGTFAIFAQSARRLEEWVLAGRVGPRPPGRLRPYHAPQIRKRTQRWATPIYRGFLDPDARPRRLRRKGMF